MCYLNEIITNKQRQRDNNEPVFELPVEIEGIVKSKDHPEYLEVFLENLLFKGYLI